MPHHSRLHPVSHASFAALDNLRRLPSRWADDPHRLRVLSSHHAAAVEVRYIFHPENAKPRAARLPGLLIALVLMYPLLTILGMVLIIPLVMYVTDHAPFQSLNMLRPDHFIQLVVQVYRAWLSSAGGKLKPKDL